MGPLLPLTTHAGWVLPRDEHDRGHPVGGDEPQ